MWYKRLDMARSRLNENTRTLALGALAVAVLGAAGVYGAFLLVWNKKAEFLASRLAYLEVVADLKASGIRDFHRERISDLAFYSSDPHLREEYRETLAGKRGPLNDAQTTFAALIDRGLYESVALRDRRGRLALSVPAGAETAAPSDGPAGPPRLLGLRRAAGGRPVLDYEAATVDGARLLFRVRSASWLSPLVERWPGAEKTAEVLIFQRDGGALTAVTAPRRADEYSAPLSVALDGDAVAARAARGEEGLLHGKDHRGATVYAAARRFPELGWVLVAKADEAELLAPLREKFLLHLLAAFGLAALAGAGVLLIVRVQADRARAEGDAERRLLSAAIEQAGESIVITDKEGRIVYTNPAFTRTTGFTREETRGRTPAILKSGRHDAGFYQEMWGVLARGDSWKGRLINRRKNGSLFEEDAMITPVRDEAGAVVHYIGVKRDISAVKSLEDQLFHSQKMEAIGRLAGGVAHDFNNILTTINGYAEMLADGAPPESPLSADLAEILGAGRRAALLTRQLLSFSRRAPADPVVADLRAPVRAMEKMLRRTLGEDVRLVLELPGEPLWVRTDPGQIEQILMNLAVNARDAMARGGTLSVRVRGAELAADEVRGLEVIPAGRYAEIVVEDDGCGMDASVLSRIFEPFFTTKEKGKGTGLGLSTVFGLVKQNQGFVSVDSAPGRGSTFAVHLPLVAAPPARPAPEPTPPPSSLRGDETVLLVEDQPEVLRMVSRVLTAQGYHVIACGGVDWALEMAQASERPIHLLLTDVVMPGMGGEELAAHVRRLSPATRVLFMSGYTDGRLDRLHESGEKVDLLLKPFTADQICRRVRDALDGARGRGA